LVSHFFKHKVSFGLECHYLFYFLWILQYSGRTAGRLLKFRQPVRAPVIAEPVTDSRFKGSGFAFVAGLIK
jgi:hypothetical protein